MKRLLSLVLTLTMLCTMCIAFGVTANAEAPSGNFVTFSSANPFTITATPMWDGTLYYSTNGEEASWAEYAGGTALPAAQIGGDGDYYLCFRGERNTRISSNAAWVITGSSVACSGSVENLRDYTGEMPMVDYCYASMFSGCTALVTAPSLPATTLAERCYFRMFYGCTGIKLYENEAAFGGVSAEWAIPVAANADGLTGWNTDMFSGTGGDFTGVPEIGKTYYYPNPSLSPKSHDVTASYQAGATADTVYSVEITWGSMEFTYTDASQGTWNPETLQYENAVAAGWTCEADANKITVKNCSNASVDAALSFAESITGISCGFYDAATGGNTITGNSFALASAAPVGEATTGTEQIGTAYIQITAGSLTSGQTDMKIGSVTVEVN